MPINFQGASYPLEIFTQVDTTANTVTPSFQTIKDIQLEVGTYTFELFFVITNNDDAASINYNFRIAQVSPAVMNFPFRMHQNLAHQGSGGIGTFSGGNQISTGATTITVGTPNFRYGGQKFYGRVVVTTAGILRADMNQSVLATAPSSVSLFAKFTKVL